ncbi:MAG: glycosyltransferase [Candidatus Thermoplasmatota archaeon]
MRTALVILTYNGRSLIDACLAAVRANTDLRETEVVVVDNASTDGSADHVVQAHPWVRLLRNRENLGFAGGVNTGIAAVAADAYVLLNTDALVTPGWLAHLQQTMVALDAGIVSALEVDEAGKPRWGPDLPPIEHRRPEERDIVSFACAIIRRDVVDRIGYLDHGFFMYHEDWDYCRRAQAAGFRVVFDPAAVVVHPGEGSFKTQVPAWKARIRTESRLRYQAMHWTPARRLQSAFREPLVAGYWAKQGLLRPYLQGMRAAWRDRRRIRQRRSDPTGYIGWGDRRLHVAMTIPWPSWNRAGGAERHVHELATALAALDVRTTVIVPGPVDVPAPADLAYDVIVVDSHRLRRLRSIRKALPAGRTVVVARIDAETNRLAEQAARRIGADVLHRHFTYEVGFRPRLPLVYTLHNGNLPADEASGDDGALVQADRRRRARAMRRAIEDADRVICVSGHVQDSVIGRLGANARSIVIHNGCGHRPPDLSKAQARARLGLGSERIVLFIGHLWRHKRVLRLLPLLDEPDCHLALIGTGELEPDLRSIAAGNPRLRLLGFVDEEQKRLWLRAADVLALPSGTFEGNPLVLLEALRSGTPVYGTMAAWLPEGLRKYGRFGDDVRLALGAMAIDATPAIDEVPDWSEVARQTLPVYRDAVASFGRAKE